MNKSLLRRKDRLKDTTTQIATPSLAPKKKGQHTRPRIPLAECHNTKNRDRQGWRLGKRPPSVSEAPEQLTKLKKKGRNQTTQNSTSPSLKLTATEAATPSLAWKENGGHTRRANSQIRRCRARKGKRQAWRLGKRWRKPKKVRGRPRSFYIIDYCERSEHISL